MEKLALRDIIKTRQVLASFRFARYTVLMSPNKDETAVHGYGLSLSVLVVLMSRKAKRYSSGPANVIVKCTEQNLDMTNLDLTKSSL